MRVKRASGEQGLTLVELLFTVVILGVISAAIATLMITFLKVNDSTADSLTNSRYAQILGTWFPADVQSAEPEGSFGTSSEGAGDIGCVPGDLAAFGTNELRLVLFDAGTPMVVSYRVDAANERLLRVTCSGGGVPHSQVMVEGVRSASDVDVTLDTFELASGVEIVSSVNMSVTMHRDNRESTFAISASPRAAVPVTAVDPGGGGPTDPTDPCTLASASPNPLEMLGANVSGGLVTTTVVVPATLSIDVDGTCGADLRVSFHKHPNYPLNWLTPGEVAPALEPTGTAGLFTYSFSSGAPGGRWQSGPRTATVERLLSNGNWEEIGTFQLNAVQAPCLFSGGSVTPSPVYLRGTDDDQRVLGSHTVRVDLAGVCTDVDVRATFESRPGSPVTLNFPGSGLTRTATISSSTNNNLWVGGDKLVTVERQPGSAWEPFAPAASFVFATETDNCTVSSGSVSPAVINTATNGTLLQPLNVAVSTSAACGTELQVVVLTRSGNSVPVSLAPNPTFTEWTATIPTTFEATRWSNSGQRTATVQRRLGGVFTGVSPASVINFGITVPTCTVLEGGIDRDWAWLTPGQASSNTRSLSTSFQLQIETNEFCGNRLRAIIETRTSGSNRSDDIVMQGGPTQWTVTVPATFQGTRWQRGTRAVAAEYGVGSSGWANATGGMTFSADSEPCTFASGSVVGGPVNLLGTGLANRSVTGSPSYQLRVQTNAACGDIRVSYDPDSNPSTSNSVTTDLSGGPVWTTNITNTTAAGQWSLGEKTVTVQYNNGSGWVSFTPAAVFTFNTQQAPCVFGSGSATGPVQVIGTGDARTVSNAVTLNTTTTTTGECRFGLRFIFAPGASGPVEFTPTSNAAGTSWSFGINSGIAGGGWSIGPKTVTVARVEGATLTPIGTFPLTVEPTPCVFTPGSGSLTGGPVRLVGAWDAESVSGSYGVSLSTTGSCSDGVRLLLDVGGSNAPLTLTPNGTFTQWTGTIDSLVAAGQWSVGTITATVQRWNGSAFVGLPTPASFNFTSTAVTCQYTAGSGQVTPSTASLGPGSFLLNRRVLETDHVIRLTTVTPCGERLRAVVTVRSGATANTVDLIPNAAGTTWTVPMDAGFAGREWQTGTRAVTFQRYVSGAFVNFTPNATFNFTANA